MNEQRDGPPVGHASFRQEQVIGGSRPEFVGDVELAIGLLAVPLRIARPAFDQGGMFRHQRAVIVFGLVICHGDQNSLAEPSS